MSSFLQLTQGTKAAIGVAAALTIAVAGIGASGVFCQNSRICIFEYYKGGLKPEKEFKYSLKYSNGKRKYVGDPQ